MSGKFLTLNWTAKGRARYYVQPDLTRLQLERETMPPSHFENLLQFSSFATRVPLHITPDGNWIAYNTTTQDRGQSGSAGFSLYSQTGVMYEMERGTVWIANAQTGESRNLTPGWGSSWAPRWSPDGKRLAFFSDKTGSPRLYIWDRAADEMRAVDSKPVRTLFGFEVPKWTPDGRHILFKTVSFEEVPPAQSDADSFDDPHDISFVEMRGWTSAEAEGEPAQQDRPSEEPKAEEQGSANLELAMANAETGASFSLTEGLDLRSCDIAPNGQYAAVTVALGSETPAAQQQIFDLYAVSLPKKPADGGAAIKPLARRIRLAYGITLSWSPDSRYVAWTTGGEGGKLAAGNARVVNVETGETRCLTEKTTLDLGRLYQPPLWLSEEALLCLKKRQLWKVPLNGSAVQNLTEAFEHDVHDVLYPSEGYAPWTVGSAVVVRSGSRFYSFDLSDGASELLYQDADRTFHAGRFCQDAAEKSGRFIYIAESAQEPPNIYIAGAGLESPRRVTDINPRMQAAAFGESELVEWTLEDGRRHQGILALPPDASEKSPAPLIAVVYPDDMPSHYIDDFAWGWDISGAHPSMFLPQGYAVLLPDFPVEEIEPYKGFSSAVLPAVEAAAASPRVDSERVGVVGASFGGYAVHVLLTQTRRFKAAVAVASFGNLISQFLSGSSGWVEAGDGGMGGSLWEYPQRYVDGSPVFHLDKVETPLLLVHGEEDHVPFEQAEEIFEGLSYLGKEVALLKYKGGDHALGNWSNETLADYWRRVFEWFDRHLKRQ